MNEFDASTHALPGARPSSMQVRAISFTVSSGPDSGKQARMTTPTFVIGTGPGADLRLSDGTVSRVHARLALSPNGLTVRDEGSRNGTLFAGVRIHHALITNDVTLTLGSTQIALRFDAGATEVPLSENETFGEAVGISPAIRNVFFVLERAARTDVSVLLEGESGVGKDVLARSVHAQSRRKNGPFIAIDCGAIPENLIESELFGHERGAFTGANAARVGAFESANGGTIFLDEIGELPLDMQPKLLRVLETREVRPVGSNTPRSIDVRIVAATNRKLGEASQKGDFRKDLFYRLAVARVVVPALRDRPEDIVPLARTFLRAATGEAEPDLPPDFEAMLRSYSWPGNVREMRNVIDRFALLGVRDPVALFDGAQPQGAGAEDLSLLPFAEARRIALERFQRDYFPKVLERAGGVVTKAAEMAGIARPSFYRLHGKPDSDD